jgi:SAM-dependent methyltransferase
MNSATSINNYEYLDILDRAWARSGRTPGSAAVVCDVGCASFWYAAALQAFFRPRELVGVEIEGHRLFKDGRVRRDYALGYIADLPNARYMVADYLTIEVRADVITAWFPFVTPAALLAWRLPLSLLTPDRLLARIYHNLRPGGRFVMVNHGSEEAETAANLCIAAGFFRLFSCAEPGAFSRSRAHPPHLSCWSRGPPLDDYS